MKNLFKYVLICIVILMVVFLWLLESHIVHKRETRVTIDNSDELIAHKVDIGELEEIVIINGESENWKLKDFKVFNFDQYQITGTGSIEFLGSKEELDNMTFFAPRVTVKREGQNREEYLCGDCYSVNNLGGTSIFNENENGQWLYEIPRMMSNFAKHDIRAYDKTVKITVEIEYRNDKHDSIKEIIPVEVLVINKEIFEDIGRFSFSH
ncbi:hypothetical protein [Oceanirhabdus seepicola]|uniref:Uncharacterized protein n=1 Tax=Oceanirhabdus seepicola TaxID=2828781 RepID=A0A9J6P5R4_9CLOT|nr:hypothetical protein [Oceanirhabdus seepicola]MCM1991457.1 hypothetical protein [Oceanirhabdus seepicola]